METSVIWSKPALDITCRPDLVGNQLAKLAEKSSEDFIRSLNIDSLGERPISLEILNGGHYYFVSTAYTAVSGKPCDVASLRAKRSFNEDTKNWSVRVWEEHLDSLKNCTSLLIGDTIATGTTLVGVLEHVLNVMESNGNIVDIYLFTIAGSYECEHQLQKFADRLARAGKKLRLTYCNCKFALADNGTDLKFCDARDLVPDAQSGLREALPEGFEKRMRCAVWDWGDRFTQPKQHLDEVVEYFHSIGGVPRWLQDGLNISYAQVSDDSAEAQKAQNKRKSVW